MLKGKNNKLSLVYEKEDKYCKKTYHRNDQHKFIREALFYSLLNNSKFIPKLKRIDFRNREIQTHFIYADHPQKFDDRIYDLFIKIIKSIRNKNIFHGLIAQEAIFNERDLLSTIYIRLEKKYCFTYVDNNVQTLFESVKSRYAGRVNDIPNSYFFNEVIFSPSDMGIHNSFDINENLVIFDFEYSGMDSIYNLLFNLILHPKHINMSISMDLVGLINNAASKIELELIDTSVLKNIIQNYINLISLRLINALSDDVINSRICKGIINNKVELENYIQEIYNNLIFYQEK